MKKITTTIVLFFSISLAIAQTDCSTALPIALNSTTTAPAFASETGTAPSQLCGLTGGGGTKGKWYTYTALQNNTVVVSTLLPQNNNADTRVIVYTGTCASLVCVGSNDDYNGTNPSYLIFAVTAGTTYTIETRLMIKKNDGWKFYEYVWNDEQTEANLVAGADFTNGSSQTITFTKPNNELITTDYRIPSDGECFACHKINEIATPIGVKPQNLNHNHTYDNVSKKILQKLVEQGYLDSYPSSIVSTVDYRDTTQPLDLRLRSYLDINCAHCHQDQARCFYRPIRLPFSQTNVDSNIGTCLVADEVISPTLQKIISPGNYSKSIMHYRLSSNDESERMPLLGRTIVHDEGVALLEEYISSLTQTCN